CPPWWMAEAIHPTGWKDGGPGSGASWERPWPRCGRNEASRPRPLPQVSGWARMQVVVRTLVRGYVAACFPDWSPGYESAFMRSSPGARGGLALQRSQAQQVDATAVGVEHAEAVLADL